MKRNFRVGNVIFGVVILGVSAFLFLVTLGMRPLLGAEHLFPLVRILGFVYSTIPLVAGILYLLRFSTRSDRYELRKSRGEL